MTTEEAIDHVAKHYRGVKDPCPHCHGMGCHWYDSTATWRGGMGGASVTMDICDQCWGSGDKHRPGTDIRRLEERLREKAAADCADWLGRELGTGFDRWRACLRHFADVIAAMERKRKIPDGIDWVDWTAMTRVFPKVLRRVVDAAENQG